MRENDTIQIIEIKNGSLLDRDQGEYRVIFERKEVVEDERERHVIADSC